MDRRHNVELDWISTRHNSGLFGVSVGGSVTSIQGLPGPLTHKLQPFGLTIRTDPDIRGCRPLTIHKERVLAIQLDQVHKCSLIRSMQAGRLYSCRHLPMTLDLA